MPVSGKSNYLANKILDHIHGGPDYVRSATTYWALFTTAPTAAGGGVEVTGGSYGRVAVTNNGTNWPSATSEQKQNGTVVDWGTATATWGIIVAVAEFDSSGGGNMLNFAVLSTPRTVNTGESFQIPVNGATFEEA